MNAPATCHQCGNPIPEDAPSGICPGCLLGVGLGKDEPEMTQEWASPGSRFMAPTRDQLAASFPQLEILEFLGQGGMGAVYKVRQRSLDRLAALKIIPIVHEEKGFSERFIREARALAKLTHPNIVLIFEFGETPDYYYFLMEYVDGVNLREALAAEEVTADQALAIVPQICDALQFAHEEGVVHRDIKPENVLLDRRGRVKIADFGLAKLIRKTEATQTLTGTHQVMGTLHYMAPEQMERPQSVDHRADIYSLGVVFYELLTGELPLGRFDPPSRRKQVDVKLDEVVMRTLEKEPDRRYQHASELKQAVTSAAAPPRVAGVLPAGIGKVDDQTQQRSSNFNNERIFVPFSIGDEMGMSNAEGVLSCDGRMLKVKAHRKDFFGQFLSQGEKVIDIDLDDVASLESRSMGWSRRLHLVLLDGQLAQTIPSASRGRLILKVSSEDAVACDQLSNAFQLLQDGVSWEQALRIVRRRSPEQLHPLVHVKVDRKRLQRSLRGLMYTFVLLGIVDLLAGFGIPAYFIVTSVAFGEPSQNRPVSTSVTGDSSSTILIRQEGSESQTASSAQTTGAVVRSDSESDTDSTTTDDLAVEEAEAEEAEATEQAGEQSTAAKIKALLAELGNGQMSSFDSPQDAPSSSRLAWLLAFSSVIYGCFACLQFYAAAKLHKVESWGITLTAAILLLLPLHPTALLTIPAAIVMIVAISRRSFRAVCVQNELTEEDQQELLLTAAPQKKPKPV